MLFGGCFTGSTLEPLCRIHVLWAYKSYTRHVDGTSTEPTGGEPPGSLQLITGTQHKALVGRKGYIDYRPHGPLSGL